MLTTHGHPIRCLLMGYLGTGNTGSDMRLLTVIDDVRHAFGPDTCITVASIDCQRTAAILPKDDRIRVVQISFSPHRFIPAAWKLARSHDVTMLIEGSTFKQNWSPWLLHAYLWLAKYAQWNRRHVVAYAVDVGELSWFHRFFTRWMVNAMSLVITRTEIARQRLIDMGVTRPVIANTDTAFQFPSVSDSDDERVAKRRSRRLVGIAPIEFHHWPVRLKLWGRAEDRYRWPFSFTWTPERRHLSQTVIANFVRLTEHAIRKHDCDVTLIAMEDIDAPVCERILDGLAADFRSCVTTASSRQLPPAQMTALLRSLDALVTSRYHACVLSMDNAVPQMAISHDERLASIYHELELADSCLLDYRLPDLGNQMISVFDQLLLNGASVSQRIAEMRDGRFLPLCMKNRSDLATWAATVFPFELPVTSRIVDSDTQQPKSDPDLTSTKPVDEVTALALSGAVRD